MQLEIFAAVNIRIAVFWDGVVGDCQHFGGTYYFLLQGRYITGHFLAVIRWKSV
jgi:hypothetical protein